MMAVETPRWYRMLLDRSEASVMQHLFEFGKGVGVAALRRDAVRVRDKLDNRAATVFTQNLRRSCTQVGGSNRLAGKFSPLV